MTGQAIRNIERLRHLTDQTAEDVATELGLCAPYIKVLARQNGIQLKPSVVRDRTIISPAKKSRLQNLHECARQGLTRKEAAARLGCAYETVANLCARHGIELAGGKRGRPHGTYRAVPNARSEAMLALYRSGKTLQQIGDLYGVTRERVRQIMTRFYGVRACDGGQHVVALDKQGKLAARRNARIQRTKGCSLEQYKTLRDMQPSPIRGFCMQRSNAQRRGIGWELTLWQWWSLWQQSGHWPERGRGSGYCMCRLNDTGPYSVDNVYIATTSENIHDYWVNKRASQVAA